MNGFSLCLIVLIAASAVFGQGILPPTRTRSGTRPAGRPFTMPSPVAPAPPPAAPVVYNPLPAPAPAPVAAPYIPPAQPQTYLPPQQQYLPPMQQPLPQPAQPMINPFFPPAQQPIQLPPQMPQQMPPTQMPPPTQTPNLLSFLNLFAPTPPPAPVMSCASMCTTVPFNQVCSMFGTTFTNDCYRQCSGEPFACNGPCPCPAPPQPIYHVQVSECGYCRNPFAFGEDYSPVCVEDDKTLYNECEARCKGKTIKCTSTCPC